MARRLVTALALGTLFASPLRAAAPEARVVWAHGASAAVAARDSIAAAPGDSVRFAWRGRPIAAGTILLLVDARLAVVDIGSGSLASARDLDRVQVRIEPGSRPHPARLRVGHPSIARSDALLACGGNARGDSVYATGVADGRTQRLTGRAAGARGSAWPDTLDIHFFDDPVDEEIALARGEIDAAVFWPGELSPSMRREAPTEDVAWGVRASGMMVAWVRADSAAAGGAWLTAADQRAFEALRAGLFRGDLMAGEALRAAPADSSWSPVLTQYVVERACANGTAIAGALSPAGRRVDRPMRFVHVACLDVAAGAPDSVIAAHVARLEASSPQPPGRGTLRVATLFTLRCPVVAAPGRRREVFAIGADALANLVRCLPAGNAR